MLVEIRADGSAQISGYVNATEKMSRPVITGKGQRVIEIIEPRAFEQALGRADNVPMTKHHEEQVLAETRAGNLTLFEDAIGLHADTVVIDAQTVAEARAGKIKGWSFGMKNVVDTIEERADALPIRRVSAFDLDHITLVVNARPVYAATSIEVRAGADIDIETRAFEDAPNVTEVVKPPDNSEYRNRINAIKGK